MHLKLRPWHALSALVVGAFLLTHMANHLAGLAGQERHMAFMQSARVVYRNPIIEPVLLALLVWQIGSGAAMVARSWADRSGFVAWLQALSGLYLAMFLLSHVGAVLSGRRILHLDTDFRYAAAGIFVPPWQWFFIPYYFMAVATFFAHVGCAVYWNLGEEWASRRIPVLTGFIVAGVLAASLIVLSLTGKLNPVDIPAAYRATYETRSQ